MKHRTLMISFLCVMAMVGTFCVPSAFSQAQTFKLTYSHFWPVGHQVTESLAEWAKEIEKRTNGRVKTVMFPGGTLTPADKCYDGVVKGISTVCSSALSYTRGRFPLMEVSDLPLGYKTALAAAKLSNAVYKKFQPKELDDVKVMFFHATGPTILHTKKPVRKLEDLKGMKIRTTGLGAKIITALGATPVAMPMGDTYDALSKGVVEGSTAPIASLEGFKWGEVVKYTTENFGTAFTTVFFVVMNKKVWNSMPPDIQKTIEQVNEEWVEKIGKIWDKYDQAGRNFTLKLGNTIIPLSKEEDARWAKKVRTTLDDYVKVTNAKNLPGNEVLNFSLDYLKKIQ
ncbi:MAG: Lactate-binding periplasmic protein precursor [Syntrophorhabdus sp. PtaU1.Bin058]|nr:MAG: Lactate-binding periplasmic protein precursor [Syntrophorhabdus sp. PtaU1.Bin058]